MFDKVITGSMVVIGLSILAIIGTLVYVSSQEPTSSTVPPAQGAVEQRKTVDLPNTLTTPPDTTTSLTEAPRAFSLTTAPIPETTTIEAPTTTTEAPVANVSGGDVVPVTTTQDTTPTTTAPSTTSTQRTTTTLKETTTLPTVSIPDLTPTTTTPSTTTQGDTP